MSRKRTEPPPVGVRFQSRPKPSERTTRPPSGLWDRLRVLLLLVGAILMVAYTRDAASNAVDFREALRATVADYWWIVVLIGVEIVRQFHYFVEEQSPSYFRFWDRFHRRTGDAIGRVDPWTKYRIGRLLRYLFALYIAGVVVANFTADDESPIEALLFLPVRILEALPLFAQLSFAFLWIAIQFIAIWYFATRGGIDTYYPDDIETRFTDVWGQDQVLERIKENLVFLTNPEGIEERGGYVPGGVLLWGPPGTGKTLMAQAVAGEAGVPFMYVEPAALSSGAGFFKVKLLYRKLRKLAIKYGGTVVFFDEADALGSRSYGERRGDDWGMVPGILSSQPMCHGAGYVPGDHLTELLRWSTRDDRPEPTPRFFFFGGGMGGGSLQMLLAEMSGLQKPRGFWNRTFRRIVGMRPKPPPKYRILHMFATNMPERLDPALLRPGRVDRKYRVGFPSKDGRIRTYQGYFDKVKNVVTEGEIEQLALMTPFYSGADVKDLVNEALVTAIREGRDTVTWADVMKAKRAKDLGPPQDIEFIQRERHAVAVHEACHAVVAHRMEKDRVIDLATIEPGSGYLGMVRPTRKEDLYTKWRSDYEATIMTFVASLAGERLFFHGDSTSGVGHDLEAATGYAAMMEGWWGMGKTVASYEVTGRAQIGGTRPGKDRTREGEDPIFLSLGARIEGNLEKLVERTTDLLRERRTEVLVLAHALETHKTLDGDDVAAILDGTMGRLIDGRPYHDPTFVEALEDYHRKVAEAHEAKVDVKDRLPIVIPAPPLGALVPPAPDGGNGRREPVRRDGSSGSDGA